MVFHIVIFPPIHIHLRIAPPRPPLPISDKEEVPDNEEGIDDTAAAADINNTTVDDAARGSTGQVPTSFF